MEDNNSKKMTLLKFIIIFFAIIIIVGIFLLVVYLKNDSSSTTETNPVVTNKVEENVVEEEPVENTVEEVENTITEEVEQSDPYEELTVNDHVYYQRLNNKTWSGEYHKDVFNTEAYIEIGEVVSYDDYLKYIEKVNSIIMNNATITNYYKDTKSNYIILAYASGISRCQMDIVDCIEHDDMVTIYGDEINEGSMQSGSGYFIVIPTKLPVDTDIEYMECYSKEEINNMKKGN